MYDYKKLANVFVKIHIIITEATSFNDRSEYIAIIKSFE